MGRSVERGEYFLLRDEAVPRQRPDKQEPGHINSEGEWPGVWRCRAHTVLDPFFRAAERKECGCVVGEGERRAC